jgi:hypothetical protein
MQGNGGGLSTRGDCSAKAPDYRIEQYLFVKGKAVISIPSF